MCCCRNTEIRKFPKYPRTCHEVCPVSMTACLIPPFGWNSARLQRDRTFSPLFLPLWCLCHLQLILQGMLPCCDTHSSFIRPSNFMQARPNSSSANQEIHRILWNVKVHYCVHNSPPLDPILNWINPVHTPLPCLHEVHFNIIPSPKPRSSRWTLSYRSSDQNSVLH
jgi:hypothetical protein